ncbi:MAG: RNA polymerase sigma factor [Acidobacteria bacterium]|nr:RNA polymerase sigma factor [Acidobacteriota bacterium]
MDAVSTPGAVAMVPDSPDQRLATLFDTQYDRLYRLARRLSPSADDALDLVQETFLKVAAGSASVPVGDRAEEAYLVRVLVNVRKDQWRKERVRARHAEPPLASDNGGGAEASLLAHDEIWRALDTLAPRRRAVVVMHELEGLSAAEIASLLGVAAVTVRWHLFRGRRDLAAALHGKGRTS